MHVLVLYVPDLQAAFHTVALSAFDWLIATAVAFTLLIFAELAKWALRSGMGPNRTAATA